MARSFDEIGPDRHRLVIREGGRCLSAFGLTFFGAGLFMSLAALGIVPMSNSSNLPAYASPALVFMGFLFTAVGGTLVFGRAWTTVDATRRQVVKEWLDFSTRESAVASARLAAEQRARESDRLTSTSPTIGPRTERLIELLSRLTKGRGGTVKTRRGLTTFGEGLADDEIRYLHGVVRRALLR